MGDSFMNQFQSAAGRWLGSLATTVTTGSGLFVPAVEEGQGRSRTKGGGAVEAGGPPALRVVAAAGPRAAIPNAGRADSSGAGPGGADSAALHAGYSLRRLKEKPMQMLRPKIVFFA